MNTYTIHLELFGHKIKTTILADTEAQAKEKVKNEIIFHTIKEKIGDFDTLFDAFGGIRRFFVGK